MRIERIVSDGDIIILKRLVEQYRKAELKEMVVAYKTEFCNEWTYWHFFEIIFVLSELLDKVEAMEVQNA